MAETVSEPEILAILQPMIKRYALERHEGEHFGDFVIRAGYIAPTTSGKEDNVFVTRSYDATSHFETVVEDVQDVWKRVVGADLVLKKRDVEVEA